MSALLIVGCIYCFVTASPRFVFAASHSTRECDWARALTTCVTGAQVKNADQKCSEELHRARKLSRVQVRHGVHESKPPE